MKLGHFYKNNYIKTILSLFDEIKFVEKVDSSYLVKISWFFEEIVLVPFYIID